MQNLEEELREYIDILLNKPEGQIGRDYLRQRKILKNTAIKWEMGYCPVGYVPPIYKDEKFPFWEKLWGRIVFPIRNSNGKLISISGRKIVEIPEREKNPKYDHYPFASRETLFGLWINKGNIFKEDRAIITEGQLDVITAWQKGIKIVTSSFGAHCGETHFALLNRYTSNIIIMYDNDEAGKKGMQKARDICRKYKISVKIKCPFSEGTDMDNWLQKHTKEDFYRLLEYNKMSYIMDKLKKIES